MDGQNESLTELAFRYVSGELDAVAETAFEERLLVDLTACEAVATAQAAVELIGQVGLVGTGVVAVPVAAGQATRGAAGTRWVGIRLAGVRAAAALVLVAGVFGWALTWRHEAVRPVNGESDIAVVAAWRAGAEVLGDGVAIEEPLLAENSASDLEVPGWMVTALEHEAEADEPMDN